MCSKTKSLHLVADIDLSAITCPGVWLPRRQEIYISVCFLGQYRRTCLVSPTFPLIFRESLRFEKTFFDVRDPSHVVRLLEGQHVLIELIQLSPCNEEGILLGFYETSARNFLFPSHMSDGNGINRYLLFEKTNDFPPNGISPRLEFRTFTVIKDALEFVPDTMRRSRSSMSRGYEKPTFSSAIRAMETVQGFETKPIFAHRKASANLIGRTPGAEPSRSYLKRKERRTRLSQPLSPYTRYDDLPIEPEVETYVPRLSDRAIHRSLSIPRIYDWEAYPARCSPSPPLPPPYGYDSIDILARDLERASFDCY